MSEEQTLIETEVPKKKRGRPRKTKRVELPDAKGVELKDEGGNEPKKLKRYVFRAKDRSLRLVWKSSYTRKERGETEFFPAEGVQFNDWQFVIVDDTPENEKVLKRLLSHPSLGVKFALEPDETLMQESPIEIIGKLEKMSEEELCERCRKNNVTVNPGTSNEKMIIELTKVLTK